MPRILTTLSLALVLLATHQLAAAEVRAIDREPLSGTITGVDNQQRLKVKPAGSDLETGVSLDAIQDIDFGRPAVDPALDAAPLRLVLTDGSVLFGSAQAAKGEGFLTFKTQHAGTITVDVMRVLRLENRAVQGSRDLQGPTLKEREDSGFECKGHFGDGSSARMALYEADDKGVKVEIDGFDDLISRAWREVRGIVRNPAEAYRNDAFHAVATTTSGETVVGEVDGWSGSKLVLKSRYAGNISVDTDNLSSVIFRNGRFAFVSDLDPSKVEEEPFFRSPNFKQETYPFKYRRDLAQGGGPLTINGKRYAKGLGVHAISRLSYAVERRYTSFVSSFGVDDSAGKLASVEVKVLVDGKEASMEITRTVEGKEVTQRQTSFKMKKGDPALRLKVELVGVREVVLVVLADENADINDRANWASAMFIR